MWAVPVLHPAATFRSALSLGPFQAHVAGFLKRGLQGFPRVPKVERYGNASRIRWLVGECLRLKRALAVDVETGEWGHLPGFAELRAIGIGADIEEGIGMSWTWPMHPEICATLKGALANPELVKTGLNLWGYDIPVLRRYGFMLAGRVHDIRDSRRALVSTSRVSLESQASMYLLAPPWKAEAKESDSDDDKGYVDASRIPHKKLLRYNALDCAYTAKIRTHHIRELREVPEDRARRERLYRQGMRLAQVASAMHLNGFPVDEQRRRTLAVELRTLALNRSEALAETLKPYCTVKILKPDEDASKHKQFFRISANGGVNDNDLRALIYKDCARAGIESFALPIPLGDEFRTETGLAAVNRNALLLLMAEPGCPAELKKIIRAVWQVDAPLKALTTFVDSELVRSAIGPDGRMHPGHNSCATETGRWSCRRPNLYNLSEQKSADEGALQGDLPNMRDMYVAPKGYVIVHADFKQLELEVMAEYTKDEALRRMLDTGDAHTARVYEWFGVKQGEPVPKMVRRQGKVVGFASQYAAGLAAVWTQVLAQIPDARFEDILALHATFPKKHPGIRQHWEDSLAFAEKHGYNETPIVKRRRYYPAGEPIKPTDTSNYAIQGGAADIANCTMVGLGEEDFPNSLAAKLVKYFPKAWLATTTYDSFDVIAPSEQAESVLALVQECMAGPWQIGGAPKLYASDGKIGERWSEV